MMSRSTFSPADEFQRCGEMLSKHWIIAVPPAVASVAIVLVVFATLITLIGSAVAGALLGGSHPEAGAGAGFGLGSLLALFGVLFGFVALNVAQAVTMHASLDAFADRPPNLGASFRAIAPRLGELSLSMLLSFLVLVVPIVLCFVLIGFPLVLVAMYFLIYVQAAVVLGGEGAFAAIATSARIATTHVGATIVLAIGVFVASIAGAIANGLLVHIPLLNLVAGFAIGGLTSAFVAMTTARFYVVLKDMPPDAGFGGTATPAAQPPPAPPQPPSLTGPY